MLSTSLAGCASESSDPPGEIPSGTPLQVEAAPIVSVGVLEGDTAQQFGSVGTPFLMGDGQLVVPDVQQRTLRIFSADGSLRRSFGGAGAGPGEFTLLSGAWPRGDSIEIYDSRLRRVTRLGSDGGFTTHPLVADPQGYSAIIPGTVADGWAGFGLSANVPGQDTMRISLIDPDGRSTLRVAEVPGMIRAQLPGVSGPVPLSPRNTQVVRGGHLYFGNTWDPSIRVVDADGALVREVVIRQDDGISVREAWERARQSMLARSGVDEAESIVLRFTAVSVPDRVPVYANFLVDDVGFVWVLPYDPEVHSFTPSPLNVGPIWRIFSPDGAEVGSVAVPADLDLTFITRDAIVGIRRDDLGVESVHVHGVTRM